LAKLLRTGLIPGNRQTLEKVFTSKDLRHLIRIWQFRFRYEQDKMSPVNSTRAPFHPVFVFVADELRELLDGPDTNFGPVFVWINNCQIKLTSSLVDMILGMPEPLNTVCNSTKSCTKTPDHFLRTMGQCFDAVP
jgi:hypothetical protein